LYARVDEGDALHVGLEFAGHRGHLLDYGYDGARGDGLRKRREGEYEDWEKTHCDEVEDAGWMVSGPDDVRMEYFISRPVGLC
jgi:hypothetical protein